ncbi:MAG TPA: alpha/beta hydrolase [Acidobacteriota bacterium]|nr:alpha/beta hydrolase [Acidobacteriota bacterium]
MTRCVYLLTVLSLAFGSTAAFGQEAESPPVVIVHGAWGGGWDWKPVADEFQARGHDVYRAMLTGLGERHHLASADIGLGLHVTDVVNLIVWEQLKDVVLVGHSYGGMVITGVAEQIPDRIGQLVYVDAFLPFDGECARSAQNQDRSACDGFDDEEGGGFIRFSEGFLVPGWVKPNATPPHDVPHPAQTLLDRLELAGSPGAGRPAGYIITRETPDGPDGFDWAAKRARELGWRVAEMRADHNPQRSHVAELVDLVLSFLR